MARAKDLKTSNTVDPNEVYIHLRSLGISEHHAIGMVANIKAESNFNPTISEKGGGGIGLFQHTGPRRTALLNHVNNDLSDWKAQIAYAMTEPDTKKYLQQNFQSPEEASYWFTTQWERPSEKERRAIERQDYIKTFDSGRHATTTYVPTTSTSSTETTTPLGVNNPSEFRVVTPSKEQEAAFKEDIETQKVKTAKEEKDPEVKELTEAQKEQNRRVEFMNLYNTPSEEVNKPLPTQEVAPSATELGLYSQGPAIEVQQVNQPLFQTSIAAPEFGDGGKVNSSNYYTVGDNKGVYRKVGDKWEVDHNRTGFFQPLTSGNVEKRTAVLNEQAKPLYDQDYNTLAQTRTYEKAPNQESSSKQSTQQKQSQQNFNEDFKVTDKDNYTKIQDKISLDKDKLVSWGKENNVPVTKEDLDRVEYSGWSLYGKVGNQTVPDSIKQGVEQKPQGFWDKAGDIISNPMTSAGYFMRGQDIPDYMQRDMDNGTFGYMANGDVHTERNPLDFVADFTPTGLVNDIRTTRKGFEEGNATDVAVGLLSTIPGIAELRSSYKTLKNTEELTDNLNKIGKYITTQTPLKNAYRYNPYAKGNKLNPFDENAYYRQLYSNEVPKEPLKVLRSEDGTGVSNLIQALNTTRDFQFSDGRVVKFNVLNSNSALPYFQKGSPYERWNDITQIPRPSRQEYLIESKLPLKDYEDMFPATTSYMSTNPADSEYAHLMSEDRRVLNVLKPELRDMNNYNMYTPHWLKGYTKVNPTNLRTGGRINPTEEDLLAQIVSYRKREKSFSNSVNFPKIV